MVGNMPLIYDESVKVSAFCLENSGIRGHSCGIVRAHLHRAWAISSIIRR